MNNNHINYIEFPAKDISLTKQFYQKAFGWKFTDYGPDYVSFSDAGIDGGFFKSEDQISNGALVILYHTNLAEIKAQIIEAGGQISKEIFEFPGGRRFHFLDCSGNELGVWSDK